MTTSVGLIAAFIAFLSWGFGDFFIQRAVRGAGSLAALGTIGLFGTIVLTPLAWHDLGPAFVNGQALWALVAALAVTILAALLEFRALEEGKLAVIEPIMSLELVMTVGLGLGALREHVSTLQLVLIAGVFVGVVLTALHRQAQHWWTRLFRGRSRLERGVIVGIFGAAAMALTNVATGVAAQRTNPIVTIWFVHTGIFVYSLLGELMFRHLRHALRDIRHYWRVVLSQCVFDNAAWLAYATAATVIPISITIAITESYIVLASFLGITLNRERLQPHQYLGMALAFISAVALAVTTEA